MKRAILLLCLVPSIARCGNIPPGYAERMASAIWTAEGGLHTRHPYGVLSVKVSNVNEARAVTIRSINNNWHRWESAGKPGEFISFMADRWTPVASDPVGNRNWKHNVKELMK